MIALDTNLLVRLLLQDDEAQARSAERLVVQARRDRTPLFVADVVLCELVWVLARRARHSRAEIAAAVARLLEVEGIVVADLALARRALAAYGDGRGDFADYMIREHSLAAGASHVVTFDGALRGEAGFGVS